MRTFFDDELDQARAEGRAAMLAAILHMVAKRRATVAAARAEIAELVAAGTVTRTQADEALAKLPKRTARRTSAIAPKKKTRRR